MTLADLENAVLSQLQEANVAFGSQAVYASGANYAQTTIDFWINRAYARLLDDLSDVKLVTETITFASVSGQFAYPIPVGQTASGSISTRRGTGTITGVVLTATINGTATTYTCVAADTAISALTNLAKNINASSLVTSGAPTINPLQIFLNGPSAYAITAFAAGTAGNSITLTASSSNSAVISITASGATLIGGTIQSPNIRMARSFYYQPLGLTYKLQRAGGIRLVDWNTYQTATAGGYLQYFSAGQQPDFGALDTPRKNLYLYPTPYTSGDTITLEYAPQLTNNANVPASNWGYLVNSTDAPPSALPEDLQDCIWMLATAYCWPKSREIGTMQMYMKMYKDTLHEAIANYLPASQGESFRIQDQGGLIGATEWGGLLGGLG